MLCPYSRKMELEKKTLNSYLGTMTIIAVEGQWF
jgi:hypothetical protein